MAWRSCAASTTLVAEINAGWPERDKASDGTIGDVAHQKAGTSDHLPNVADVVRARDVDKDGIDAPWLAEFLRRRGEVGDPRLVGGGYVIFNRRITTPDFKGWRVYSGRNPHTSHVHVSFTRAPAGYDSTVAWGITGPALAAPVTGRGSLTHGMRAHPEVRKVQQFMARAFPDYTRGLPATGNYYDETARVVAEFQRRVGITGPDATGRTIGPRTWAQLATFGYR